MRSAIVAVLVLPALAHAEPRTRAVEERPASAFTSTPVTPGISPYLYLNRCVGGCTVQGGAGENAAAGDSSIPAAGTFHISEFSDMNGAIGAAADADWAAVVQCVKEVYSPFAITVTDTLPDGVQYTEAMIAGQPQDIGRPIDNLGVAPIAANCSPQNNAISFTFANHHGGTGTDRLTDICWTAAQESAHVFGLDHEYEFTDGTSTCKDPMTYRVDCGGQRFFRNQRAKCGEDASRACRCGGTQNSAVQLMGVFGPGTPITAAPAVSVSSPQPGNIVTGTVVHAKASSQRGVAKMELMLNGSRWAVVPGAPFGLGGQGEPDYALAIPKSVPDGMIDIVVRATDDIGAATDSAPITVEKGAPCTSAAQCAANQSCDSGRCVFPAPTGKLGDACTYDQFCTSWTCADTGNGKFCATDCEPDEPTSCPTNFACADTGGGHGLCVPPDNGGCCSASRGGTPWPSMMLGAIVLGFVVRRRPR